MPHIGSVYWSWKDARTRVLTLTATASVANSNVLHAATGGLGETPTDAYSMAHKGAFDLIAPGSGPSSRAYFHAEAGPGRDEGFKVNCSTGFGSGASDDKTGIVIAPPFDSSFDTTSTCLCSWSVHVQQGAQLYFKDDEVAGADGDSNWGGPAVGDVNPRAIGVRFVEFAIPETTVTASISCGTASCTASDTVTTAYIVDYYANAVPSTTATVTGTVSTTSTGSCSLGGDWALIGPNSGLSHSDAHSSVTVSKGVVNVSATAVGVGAGGVSYFAAGSLEGEPDRVYEVKGHLYAGPVDYPDSLTLGILGSPTGQPQSVVLNPSGSTTFRQVSFAATASQGVPGSLTVTPLGNASEWDRVKTYLTSASLAAAHESTLDWVTMFSGRPYTVLRASHAASHTQPTPTGTTGGTWTVSYPAYPTNGNFEGYAFLRVTCATDDPGETVTVTVDGDPAKTYHLVTTASGSHDYDLDLCAPDSPAPDDDPELWDSRYPLCSDGLPLKDPSCWGVGRVRSVAVSGGTDLTLTALTLVRKDSAAVLSSLVSFLDWDLVQTYESAHAHGEIGSTEIVQGSRCVVVDVDGRRAIIEPCSLRELESDGTGAPFWVYSGRNAADLEATFNACPGFSCDHGAYAATDGWHARDGSEGANYIDGGPIYYAGWTGFLASGSVYWAGGTAVNEVGTTLFATARTLSFQPRYHEVIGYPGMGDCWGDSGGAYGTTPLRVVKAMRAAVDGIALDLDGSPLASQTVTLTDSLGNATTATTDSRGRFRMSAAPFAPGQKDAAVSLGSVTGTFDGTWDDTQGLGADDADQARNNARRWHRAVLRSILRSGGGCDVDCAPSGALLLVYERSGALWCKGARNGHPDPWDFDAAIDAGPGDFRPRLAWRYESGTWLLMYERAGRRLLRESTDATGRRWRDEQDVGYGYRPEPASSHTGALARFHLEQVAGTTPLKYQVYVEPRDDEATGLAFLAKQLVLDQDGAPLACELEGWGGIVAPWSHTGGWILAMTPYGGSDPATYVSSQRKALTFKKNP